MKYRLRIALFAIVLVFAFKNQKVNAVYNEMKDGAVEIQKVASEDIVFSGYSNNVYWQIDRSGHLEISGEGDWNKISLSNPQAPWCDHYVRIKSASVNLSDVTDVSHMFDSCTYLSSVDLSGLDTSKVTDMSYMFYNCRNLTSVDLSGLVTPKVIDMSYMFYGCNSLANVGFMKRIDLSSVKNMSYMFCPFNSSGAITSIDFSGLKTPSLEDMSFMFGAQRNLTEVNLSGMDTSAVLDMHDLFSSCDNLVTINMEGVDTSKVTDMSYMFVNCSSLQDFDFLNDINTSSVTNMSSMFNSCSSLKSLCLDSFNTSSVTDMSSMFYNCELLRKLDLKKFDTTSVTEMVGMFANCTMLDDLNISSFNTSSVTSMGAMFENCGLMTSLDLKHFDTSKVQSMERMFNGCVNLKEIKLGSFNTSNVIYMSKMFYQCRSLTQLEISNFDVSRVLYMKNMFGCCSELTKLDLSNFKCAAYPGMFEQCWNLEELDISNMGSKWNTPMEGMFDGAKRLKKLVVSDSLNYIPEGAFDTCPDIKIYGHYGTYVWMYARDNGIPFVDLDAEGFDLKKDGYSFVNEKIGFGYPRDYMYPLERLQEVFGKSFTEAQYDAYCASCKTWPGNCFGMSATSAAFYKGLLSKNKYKLGTYINDEGKIKENEGNGTYYVEAGKDSELVKLIERYCVYQSSTEYILIMNGRMNGEKTREDRKKVFTKVIDEIRECKEPLIVELSWSRGGHAVVIDSGAPDCLSREDGYYKIKVYDPNYPFYSNNAEYLMESYYDEAENRYIYIDEKTGKWKASFTQKSGEPSEWFGDFGQTENSDSISFFNVDSLPTSFDGTFHYGCGNNKERIDFKPEEGDTFNYKVYWRDGNATALILEVKNGRIKSINNDYINRFSLSGATEMEDDIQGQWSVISGNYCIEIENCSFGLWDENGFLNISTKDAANIDVFSSKSINVYSESSAMVDVYMEEIDNNNEYSAIDTSIEVGPDTSSIILSDGKLSIDTPNAQELDITFDVDGKETVVENVSTDTITDIDLEKPNPFCTDSHKLTEIAEVEATCTTPGTKAYFQCERCKLYFEDKDAKTQIEDFETWVVLPANGHTEEEIPAIVATISANGKTAGVKCAVCEEVLEKPVTVYKASKISLSKTSYIYDGKVKNPTVTVKDSKGTALLETDYTVKVPTGRKTPGEYVYKIKLKGRYTGTVEKKVVIKPQKLESKRVKLSKTTYTYDAKEHKPSVTVKNADGTTLKKEKNYTVAYAKGRKKVGLYTVTIKGIGNYSGTVTKTYVINPKATTLKSVTPQPKAFVVNWKKVTEQVDGYEIEYALDKKFKDNAKTVAVAKNTIVSKKVKDLKPKKTYYVRVRTYKKVGKKKYYSDWSKVLNVKTK